jgi:hypothetical protein
MAKYTALDFAEDVLKTVELPLTFYEIAEKGKYTDFYKKVGFTGKTPERTVGARLFVDVRDNLDSRFVKVGKNPARFFLKTRQNELSKELLTKIAIQNQNVSKVKKKYSFEERKLHPLVAYFAYTNTVFNKGRGIYTKTIFHEKSKKTGLSEWVHPDMVGFYIPIDEWNPILLEFNKISYSKSIRLFSFEIKKSIDRTNYREYFFSSSIKFVMGK